MQVWVLNCVYLSSLMQSDKTMCVYIYIYIYIYMNMILHGYVKQFKYKTT